MSPVVQLLVLAAIALYLIFKLRSVLGTRDGFEQKPPPGGMTIDQTSRVVTPREATVDEDIASHVVGDSPVAESLAEMKGVDRRFNVTEFMAGAGKAYEWILTSFAKGQVEDLKPFLSDEVYESFRSSVEQRDESEVQHANFVSLRSNSISSAYVSANTGDAEITVEFVGELISYVSDSEGNVIDGSDSEARRQKDVWTFSRNLRDPNPNWMLVATGE